MMNENMIYILTRGPIPDRSAMYADMTLDYVNPMEPDPGQIVTFSFRTGYANATSVRLCWWDRRMDMTRSFSRDGFDYYRVNIAAPEQPMEYHFEICCGKFTYFYGRDGLNSDENRVAPFCLLSGFHTPDWAKGAVMYQIFTDRFCKGDERTDVRNGEYFYAGGPTVRVEDWDSLPEPFDVRRFYGGDLKGVINKLPYLKDLGVEAIYFNPLFVSPSNHKYDVQDYDHIDPHFGAIVEDGGALLEDGDRDNKNAGRYIRRTTNMLNLEASDRLFISLVEKAHSLGIRVILDGVFNHCGSFNKWLDRERIYEDEEGYEKGAFVDEKSPYHTFFRFNGGEWPYNRNYDGWWGHDTLPKLNYEESPFLYSYIMKIASKWVSPPFNADGWRLDVAADLGHTSEFNHRFWKDFRIAVKRANPDAVIIAEHYGDASEWLKGDQWDTVMNYDAFMEPVSWFLTGMQKHSDSYNGGLLNNTGAFWDSMKRCQGAFSAGSMMCAMNELSNHDHSRFLTRTTRYVGRIGSSPASRASDGANKAVMMEAVLIQMTWIGAPTIYYGDEAGLAGFTDPDNRRSYPWGNEDFELVDFHRALSRIHREHHELRTGSLIPVNTGDGILSYVRSESGRYSLILVNNTDEEKHVKLDLGYTGMPSSCTLKRVIISYAGGFSTITREYKVIDGLIVIRIGKTSAAVFGMI